MQALYFDLEGNQVAEGQLEHTPELSEIITADDGLMYEVVEVNAESARLEQIEADEDWGE